jgi:hypothetical protein
MEISMGMKYFFLYFLFILALLVSCTSPSGVKPSTFQIAHSLSQSELAYYNDSFDELRRDLWGKAGFTHNKAQLANFQLANMSFEDGKLRVVTKTGCFSKGGLGSKYALRGDLDIQVDCHIDFLKGTHDMDQHLFLILMEKGKRVGDSYATRIVLLKKGGSHKGFMFSDFIRKTGYQTGNRHEVSGFHGALRIVRMGNKITTLYKKEGKMEWKKMNASRFTKNDVMLGFALQNFSPARTSIKAESSVTATFENFRINAAHGIIEGEI